MKDAWWVKPEDLDDDQKRVIKLPVGESTLVVGPPGSGKTNLLLLRAKHLLLSGQHNIAAVTFTRSLQEFASTGSNQYRFAGETVSTSARWFRQILFQHDQGDDLPTNFDQARDEIVKRIGALCDSGEITGSVACILLDEAQDYRSDELDLFFRIGQSVFAVADSDQRIYAHRTSVEEIRSRVKHFEELRYHYRNGLAICRFADSLRLRREGVPSLVDTSNYPEKKAPSTVERCRYASLEEQVEEAVRRVTKQVRAYPDELIGIVCPRHVELSQVCGAIEASELRGVATMQRKGDTHLEFRPTVVVSASTIHSAKGLEFRALHVVGCEHVKSFKGARRVLYTAATRAKTSLVVYHTEELPGYAEQALADASPPVPEPELDDLFAEGA